MWVPRMVLEECILRKSFLDLLCNMVTFNIYSNGIADTNSLWSGVVAEIGKVLVIDTPITK